MAALDWINNYAILPAVISMSLASAASISIDQAITNLMITRGILIVSELSKYLIIIFDLMTSVKFQSNYILSYK